MAGSFARLNYGNRCKTYHRAFGRGRRPVIRIVIRIMESGGRTSPSVPGSRSHLAGTDRIERGDEVIFGIDGGGHAGQHLPVHGEPEPLGGVMAVAGFPAFSLASLGGCGVLALLPHASRTARSPSGSLKVRPLTFDFQEFGGGTAHPQGCS